MTLNLSHTLNKFKIDKPKIVEPLDTIQHELNNVTFFTLEL